MALNNFFSINMPYGMMNNDRGEWAVFNREYMPLGINVHDFKRQEEFAYVKYPKLTTAVLEKLGYSDEYGVNKEGEGRKIFFYNDSNNPTLNSKNWDLYFKKLKILSNISQSGN